MKKKYQYQAGNKTIEREYNYIPVRYIVAALITVLEIAAIIGIMIAICLYVPYFYILCYITAFACMIKIIASDDNPDYKVPWVLFVLVIPIAGFMLYFMFYSRKLQKKFIRRLDELKRYNYKKGYFRCYECACYRSSDGGISGEDADRNIGLTLIHQHKTKLFSTRREHV